MTDVLKCPNCDSEHFDGSVYGSCTQVFDINGDYIDDSSDWEVNEGPDKFYCSECGTTAKWVDDESNPEPMEAPVEEGQPITTLEDIPSNFKEKE